MRIGFTNRVVKSASVSEADQVVHSKTATMAKSQRDGFYLVILGCVLFVLLGWALEVTSSASMTDFRIHYYTARCLLEKRDPYNPAEILRAYHAQEGINPADTPNRLQVITKYIYPPVVFVLTAPLAFLPFVACHQLWMAVNAACLVLAAFLTWNLAQSFAPVLVGSLIGFMIGNSELVLVTGNVVGIAVGLCVVAIWCFMSRKHEAIGVVCLAISLIMKPHDSGFVWLYLILAGGLYRKRALQTLATATAIGLPSLVWATRIAPHWLDELRSNLTSLAVHGGITDPGPSSSAAHALAMQINLQTAVSMFRDDPSFYNPVSYLICGVLFVIWLIKVFQSHPSSRTVWIALAAVSALTMLPTYHRQDDAKLLLLAIPACAILWVERGPLARTALAVTGGCIVITAEIPWAILLAILRSLHLQHTWLGVEFLIVVQVLPIPIMLLAVSVFYLWILPKRDSDQTTIFSS